MILIDNLQAGGHSNRGTLSPGKQSCVKLRLGKKYLKRVEVRAHRHSSPTDQMMWELGKHWDIPAQCKFNDVIRRSGDLIFFPKSNILCDLHVPYPTNIHLCIDYTYRR